MNLQMVATFLLGLSFGGAIAEATGDFLLIVTGCITLGAALGSAYVWLRQYEPQWDRGVGLGSLVGLAVGLVLAILDAGLGS